MATKPGRSGKDWTDEEIDELRRLMQAHKPLGEIALVLGRSEESVRGKVFEEGFGRRRGDPPALAKKKPA